MLNKQQLSELVKEQIILCVEGDQTPRIHKCFIVEFWIHRWELVSGKNQTYEEKKIDPVEQILLQRLGHEFSF